MFLLYFLTETYYIIYKYFFCTKYTRQSGTLERWNAGTLERWNAGTLERAHSGMLKRWHCWNAVYLKKRKGVISKINKMITTLGAAEIKQLSNASKSMDPVIQRGFEWLKKVTRIDYTPRVLDVVDVGPYGSGVGHEEWTTDCMQVWCQALMYIATRSQVYKDKMGFIIREWCTKCKEFRGSNAPLEMAWGATLLVRSMALTPDVPENVKVPFDKFLMRIVIPVLTTRYNEIAKWRNNWIFSIIECLIQIELYKPGSTSRNVRDYVTDFQMNVSEAIDLTTGLNTDSKRGDPYHFCFQLSSQIAVLQMCRHVGIEVSEKTRDLIKRSFEVHARFLLGETVTGLSDACKRYWFTHCTWESAREYYGETLVNVEKLLMSNRPETLSFNWGPGWLYYKVAPITTVKW